MALTRLRLKLLEMLLLSSDHLEQPINLRLLLLLQFLMYLPQTRCTVVMQINTPNDW